jgi:hypothetical protein
MSLHKSLNRVENNGFVNMSASCFSESTFETIISPAVTNASFFDGTRDSGQVE